MTLTREEARMVTALIDRAIQNSAGPVSPAWHVVRAKLLEMGDRAVMGDLVFRLSLPLREVEVRPGKKNRVIDNAPTMNVYSAMEPWARDNLRKRLDLLVMSEMHKWPSWRAQGRRRGVVVARHSSVRPDELSADAIGGKTPVDRLTIAGVLAGDSHKHLVREATWVRAKPGEGRVVIDVHELVEPGQQALP